MTVAALSSSMTYLEDGVTLAFAADFRFLTGTLRVSRISASGVITALVEGADFNVSGGETDAGGTVTLISTVAGAKLFIERVTARSQGMDYTTNDTFPAESHEAALDRAMLIDQEQDSAIARAFLVPKGEAGGVYPIKANRAGSFAAWDADGNFAPASGTGNDAALRADLAASGGSALVAFLQAGVGAVARSIQSKERERPTPLDYGAVGDGSHDDTAAFAACFAANLNFHAPAPPTAWSISTLVLDRDGASMTTDGFATVIHQRTGNVGSAIIQVKANRVFVGDLALTGNIATDTGEDNHGIRVQNIAANISGVTIGNIYGKDLRGDTLLISGTATRTVSNVSFGRITGNNILRNVTSIVDNCSFIFGVGAIVEGAAGYSALDIEPDNVASHDIYIGMVKGGRLQVAPVAAAYAAYNIEIGVAYLNPAFQTNSTPNYGPYDVSNGLVLRNIKNIRVGSLKLENITGLGIQYVFSTGNLRGKGIHIGYLNAINCGGSEATYNAVINASSIDDITIDEADVTHNAVGDAIIMGDPGGATFTRAIINKARVDGRVAHYIQRGRFSNITINTANATGAFLTCDDCTISDSEITIPTLISFSNRNSFINVKATCSSAYLSSTTGTTRINCDFGGAFVPWATEGVAVAALPAAATAGAGARSYVTDSNAALTAGIGAIVAAGGANKVPVVCDGANWRIG